MALGYDINTTIPTRSSKPWTCWWSRRKTAWCRPTSWTRSLTRWPTTKPPWAVYYAGDYLIMLEDNPDLVWVQPEEGANLFLDAMCVPTTCQNYDNAMGVHQLYVLQRSLCEKL